MTLVLDAPVLLEWYFSSEEGHPAEDVLMAVTSSGAEVPANWWFETRNILLAAEAAHRIDAGDTAGILADIRGLPIQTSGPGDDGQILALGRKYQLSASEASYLELASRLSATLATTNSALSTAAREEGLTTLPS